MNLDNDNNKDKKNQVRVKTNQIFLFEKLINPFTLKQIDREVASTEEKVEKEGGGEFNDEPL